MQTELPADLEVLQVEIEVPSDMAFADIRPHLTPQRTIRIEWLPVARLCAHSWANAELLLFGSRAVYPMLLKAWLSNEELESGQKDEDSHRIIDAMLESILDVMRDGRIIELTMRRAEPPSLH